MEEQPVDSPVNVALENAQREAAAQKHMLDGGNALGRALSALAQKNGGVNALQIEIYVTMVIEHLNLLTGLLVQAGIIENGMLMRTLGDTYVAKAKQLEGPNLLVANGVSASLRDRRQ